MRIITPTTRIPITRLLVPLMALSLLLVGCSGDDKKEGDDPVSTAAKPAPDEPEVPDTEPLTGVELPAGESADRDHSVLVVKMDNTYSSSPQLGLSGADMVVEELVEGGLTRLAAFYYSQTPKVVGPVRSMRASDIGIVSPVKGSIVTSGAAAVTIGRIDRAKIRHFDEGSKGIYRDQTRAAPYNVFTNLEVIAKQAKNKNGRPDDYLPWGSETDFVGVRPAKNFKVSFGFGHTTEWRYENSAYTNVNTYAADDDAFPADSVLVLKVAIGDAGYTDPAGNPVPETKLTGKGPAMLFHGGQMVRGTWEKDGLTDTIKLSTAAGPMTVPAGHVWLELVPKASGGVSFR